MTRNGLHDATDNEDIIRTWWADTPSAHVGVACARSGVAVIDVDPRNGGNETFRELEQRHGKLPATLTQHTGGDGHHYIFSDPGVPLGSKLGPGVDIKQNGYIVAAPSGHSSGGRYRWATDFAASVLADWPADWACDATRKSRPRVSGADIGSGSRNDRLTSLAGSLRRQAATYDEILDVLSYTNERRCRPPLPQREVEAIARSVANYDPVIEVDSTKPTIEIRQDLVGVTNDMEEALVASCKMKLFTRAGMIARVTNDKTKLPQGIQLTKDAPCISQAPSAFLREQAALAANWTKFDKKQNKAVAALPPPWAIQTLEARGEWRFDRLFSVTECPTLRPDGNIIDQPGLDTETGVLYLPNGQFGQIPRTPTAQEITIAKEVVVAPFVDFPFCEDCDKAAAIAACLTIACRTAISGPTPLFAIRASTPATGKSLLAEVICLLASGRTPALMTAPAGDEEARKRILAIGLAGCPALLVDNVVGSFGLPSIAAALTATEFSDSLLGESRIVTTPLTAVWLLTGNNPTFVSDLGRRVIPCDLDARVEHPEDRGGFAYPDLKRHVLEARVAFHTAALTLLRGFFVAGRPTLTRPRMGSYEAWDALIRQAIIWAELGDPSAGRARIRQEDDEDRAALRVLLASWVNKFGDDASTAAAAIKSAEGDESFRASLEGIVHGGKDRLDGRTLGSALKHCRGRIVDGRTFNALDVKKHGANQWTVENRLEEAVQ
jgi:hypothetical protein